MYQPKKDRKTPPTPNLTKELRNLVENLPVMLEYQTAVAQLQRARYKALLKEGFTEEQAIELCKSIGGC